MNKRPNPFQPTYQPPQPAPPAHPYPPLPPGPPPPGNQQQEWAAYWAQQQATSAAAYSPHAPQQGWPGQAGGPTQPPAQQPSYDPALYRNYGYGGQNAGAQAAWQQARPPAPQAYPPGHPPGYPPYPHAPYAQYPGAPAQPGMSSMTAAPQPMQYGPQYPYPSGPVAMPGQPHAPPPPLPAAMPPPGPPVSHPQHPAQQHHQPPAKRPRFDSNAQQPNPNIPPRPSIPPAPAQPPPLHFKPGGGMVPASQLNTPGPGASTGGPGANANGQRFGAGNNPPRGGGVPLGIPNRGGGQAGRGGRGGGIGAANRPNRGGGPMHGHGGHSGGVGRGGIIGGRGAYGASGRGPAPRGPPGFRPNNAGNRFQSGPFNKSHHQAPMRHDRNRQPSASSDASAGRVTGIPGLPSSSFNFTPNNAFRGASPFSGTGKRTLTDFRIVGFGIRPIVDGESDDGSATLVDLDWTWGTIPGKEVIEGVGSEVKTDATTDSAHASPEPPVQASPSSPATKLNRLALSSDGKTVNEDSRPPSPIKPQVTGEPPGVSDPPTSDVVPPPTSPTVPSNRPTTFKLSSTNSIPVAPRHQRKPHEASRSETSRIRIYFQCPAELDDKDIGATASSGQITPIKGRSWTVSSSHPGSTIGIGVGGKRKKEDDDEDDEREGGKRKREDSSTGSPVKLNDEPAGSEFEVDMQITGADDEASTPRPHADTDHAGLAQPSTDDFFGVGMGQATSMQNHSQEGNDDYDAYGDPDEDAEGEDMQGFEEWNDGMNWNAEANSAAEGALDAPASTSTQEPSTTSPDQFSNFPGSPPMSSPNPATTGPEAGGRDNAQENILKRPPSPAPEESTAVSSPQVDAQNIVGEAAPMPPVMEGSNAEMAETVSNSESAASTSTAQGQEATTSPSSPQVQTIRTDGMEETAHPLKEHEAAPASAHQVSNALRAPLPSPNRISISYAGSARRLVIDADVIESVRIKRGEGRIDVVLLLDDTTPPPTESTLSTIKEEDHEGPLPKVGGGLEIAHGDSMKPAPDELDKPEAPPSAVKSEPQDAHMVSPASLPLTTAVASSSPDPSRAQVNSRGILIDALEESSQTYKPVPHSSYDNDRTIPPFPKYLASAAAKPIRLRLLLYLDKEKPLSEPKWVKTGDIEDWLKTMFGPVKTGPQTYASWSGKISIVDPDPPPNVYALVDAWVQHSMVGPPKERRRFVNEHIKTHFDNVFEVLLRIVRRDGSQSNPAPSGSPLASALPANSIHASQQTHASLAVLSLYRLAAEFAVLAGIDGKTLETRVGQLIRSLPQAQVYKSLDSMFKDWMTAQKKTINSRGSA